MSSRKSHLVFEQQPDQSVHQKPGGQDRRVTVYIAQALYINYDITGNFAAMKVVPLQWFEGRESLQLTAGGRAASAGRNRLLRHKEGCLSPTNADDYDIRRPGCRPSFDSARTSLHSRLWQDKAQMAARNKRAPDVQRSTAGAPMNSNDFVTASKEVGKLTSPFPSPGLAHLQFRRRRGTPVLADHPLCHPQSRRSWQACRQASRRCPSCP